MKRLLLPLLCLVLFTTAAVAQDDALAKNKAYTGAVATKKSYHAIYQLDTNDPKIIGKAFRNMLNALNDPRLKGKVQLELVTFAWGTDVMLKNSPYEKDLKELIEKGVIVAQCANSVREKGLTAADLYDFVPLVPSGNGELILRQGEGWAIIKP